MAGSSTAVFSDPAAFEAAAREAGSPRLYLSGAGPFRARLTQVVPGAMRLSAVEESQARIAVLTVAPDTVLVTWPTDRSPAPVWGGIACRSGEMMTHGPGLRVLGWTPGRCRWSAIWIPAPELARYGHVLLGNGLTVPPGTRSWRPPAAPFKTLRALHAAAIHTAENQPDALAHAETARGLHQQVIHALVECLSGGTAAEDGSALGRRQDIARRFEALLDARPDRIHTPDSIRAALGISRRYLDVVCREQLGMGPAGYIRLHLARHAAAGVAAT
jgi:AraC-like DNA-binding protein